MNNLLKAIFGIFVVFAMIFSIEWFSLLPDFGVIRSSDSPPEKLKGLNHGELLMLLQAPNNQTYSLEGNILKLQPNIKVPPNEKVPNHWISSEVRLDLADPFVFGEIDRYGQYDLVIFCHQNQHCGYEDHYHSGRNKRTVAFFYLNFKDPQKVQEQVEIIRQLIILSGGKSTVDRQKNLSRLLQDFHQEEMKLDAN